MNKEISMVTLGLIIIYLLFILVNSGLEEKYGDLQPFLIPIPLSVTIDTGISTARQENQIELNIYDKKIKIPIFIDLPPLL